MYVSISPPGHHHCSTSQDKALQRQPSLVERIQDDVSLAPGSPTLDGSYRAIAENSKIPHDCWGSDSFGKEIRLTETISGFLYIFMTLPHFGDVKNDTKTRQHLRSNAPQPRRTCTGFPFFPHLIWFHLKRGKSDAMMALAIGHK